MTKFWLSVLAIHVMVLAPLYAEDSTVAAPAADTPVIETPAAPAIEAPAAPAAVEAPVAAAAPVEAAAPAIENAEAAADNLEFVSGEVTAVDEAAKSVTLKIYGEPVENEAEKVLTVTTDANTDITDGEQDRDLKSLTATTEVDVEYDPATKKATYIFVY